MRRLSGDRTSPTAPPPQHHPTGMSVGRLLIAGSLIVSGGAAAQPTASPTVAISPPRTLSPAPLEEHLRYARGVTAIELVPPQEHDRLGAEAPLRQPPPLAALMCLGGRRSVRPAVGLATVRGGGGSGGGHWLHDNVRVQMEGGGELKGIDEEGDWAQRQKGTSRSTWSRGVGGGVGGASGRRRTERGHVVASTQLAEVRGESAALRVATGAAGQRAPRKTLRGCGPRRNSLAVVASPVVVTLGKAGRRVSPPHSHALAGERGYDGVRSDGSVGRRWRPRRRPVDQGPLPPPWSTARASVRRHGGTTPGIREWALQGADLTPRPTRADEAEVTPRSDRVGARGGRRPRAAGAGLIARARAGVRSGQWGGRLGCCRDTTLTPAPHCGVAAAGVLHVCSKTALEGVRKEAGRRAALRGARRRWGGAAEGPPCTQKWTRNGIG